VLDALLRLQWNSARAWVIAAMVAAAGLPVVSVGLTWSSDASRLATFLAELDAWSLFYPALAVVLGVAMAGLAWRADRRGDFVYALTLPIERWRYVLYRFAGGAALILLVSGALWVAAVATVAAIHTGADLQAYPHALALKFALATLAVFSAAFALAALPASVRRVAARAIGVLLALQILVLLLGWDGKWLVPVAQALTDRAGPLGLLGGRWMLLDV
jgi:hypothetical protein